MTPEDISRLGLGQLSDAFAAGAVDPVEALEASLKAIGARNSRLNAVLDLRPEAARREAEASARRRKRGEALSLIDGAVFGVKANIAVAGLPLHAGIAAYRSEVATEDAEIVRRLRAKGAIPLCILNMHEGALGATTDNPHFGRCRNPLDERLTPGGSSGGSAAAVAAGFVSFALGTDTMGSVRIPSAYCGIAGFKPSRDFFSVKGLLALSPTLDHVGVHATQAEDIAHLLRALGMEAAEGAPPVSIGDWNGAVEVEEGVLADFRAAAAVLEQGGARPRADLSEFEFGVLRRRGLLVSEIEGYRIHEARLRSDRGGFSSAFAEMLDYGAAQSKEKVAAAYADIAEAGDLFAAVVASAGVLMLPTAPQGPFSFDAGAPANQADFTCLANFAGLPAFAVPATSAATSSSVQFVAPRGEDCRAVAAALAFERARGARTGRAL